MENPIITFDNVTKEYTLYKNDHQRFVSLFKEVKGAKKHLALKDVNLKIYKGEAVGIIGANGAGKSTLLKMITGVTFPTSGNVTVNGKVAALLELTAGFSAQMTGRENIYLKGYILGLTDEYIKQIEERVIEFAELGDYIDQPVRTYSSGMRMRLGFAINVNIDPDILVIDEALSVGDASFKKKCKEKIAEIMKKGITVLYVSHSKDGIQEICNRAIYLNKGCVMYDGDVSTAVQMYNDRKK
ncbi:MAG: ABC transporter ATP-binding protein [Clostridia bacterium]|nr:ABC transporter ATP-binding protein [Clostridia bacterium]